MCSHLDQRRNEMVFRDLKAGVPCDKLEQRVAEPLEEVHEHLPDGLRDELGELPDPGADDQGPVHARGVQVQDAASTRIEQLWVTCTSVISKRFCKSS